MRRFVIVLWLSGVRAECISQDRVTIDETKDGAEHSGETWSCSTGDSGTAWRVSSDAHSLKCNTSRSVMENGRRAHAAPHTCIVFRRAFISPPMITAQRQLYCLFAWKLKSSTLIPLFVHCWIRRSVNGRERNGPNYSKRRLPATPEQSEDDRGLKLGGKRTIKDCLWSAQTGTQNIPCCDPTMVHMGLQISFVNHVNLQLEHLNNPYDQAWYA